MKKWLVNFVFSQKYRFDLGLQLLVFVNFAMMCATMLKVFQIRGYWMLPLIVIAFIAVWVVGYILDKYVNMQRHTEQQSVVRSYSWELILKSQQDIRDIKKMLEGKK